MLIVARGLSQPQSWCLTPHQTSFNRSEGGCSLGMLQPHGTVECYTEEEEEERLLQPGAPPKPPNWAPEGAGKGKALLQAGGSGCRMGSGDSLGSWEVAGAQHSNTSPLPWESGELQLFCSVNPGVTDRSGRVCYSGWKSFLSCMAELPGGEPMVWWVVCGIREPQTGLG